MRYSLRKLLLATLIVPPMLAWLGAMCTVRNVNTYESQCRTRVAALESAVRLYCLHVGALPPNLHALIAPPPNLADPFTWQGSYLDRNTFPLDPWGNPFRYEILGAKQEQFRIWSAGPDGVSGTEDDIHAAW